MFMFIPFHPPPYPTHLSLHWLKIASHSKLKFKDTSKFTNFCYFLFVFLKLKLILEYILFHITRIGGFDNASALISNPVSNYINLFCFDYQCCIFNVKHWCCTPMFQLLNVFVNKYPDMCYWK